jgi:hypothetical protein
MSHTSGKRCRSGSGLILATALLSVAILSICAISRTVLTSTQSTECQATLQGELCETLASSATAEMEARLRDGLAQVDGDLAKRFYNPLTTPNSSVDLTAYVHPQEAVGCLRLPSYKGFDIDDISCTLTSQRLIDWGSYERAGVVVMRARGVWGSFGRRIYRTVEEAHSFKIVLAGPPRPLDLFGLFIGNGSNLTSFDQVNQHRTRLIDLLSRVRARLSDGEKQLTGDSKEKVLDLLDDIPTLENATSCTPVFPGNTRGCVFYGLMNTGSRINLPNLDLAKRLTESISQVERGIPGMPPASDPELAVKVRPVGKLVEDSLWSIWANQEAFKTLTSDNAQPYGEIRTALDRFDENYFLRRVHYRITPEGSADPKTKLDELLKHGPLDGVVHVENAQSRLELTGTLPGRLMLIAGAGGVTLTDVKCGNGALDRLTVVCFGKSVTINGHCQAHVITGPATTVVVEKNAILSGGLTMEDVAPGSRLEGTVVRSERYFSGPPPIPGKGSHPGTTYTLGVSPLLLYRRVTRS